MSYRKGDLANEPVRCDCNPLLLADCIMRSGAAQSNTARASVAGPPAVAISKFKSTVLCLFDRIVRRTLRDVAGSNCT